MAKVNGIEIKGKKKLANEDGSESKMGGLYIEGEKIATYLLEDEIKDCAPSAQLFMTRKYSEEKLLAAITEDGEDEDQVIFDLVSQIDWLKNLELEFLRHLGSANGAMAVLNFVGGQISIGVPMKYSKIPDQELLEMLDGRIRMTEMSYGKFISYAVFRSMTDFEKGTPVTLDMIRK